MNVRNMIPTNPKYLTAKGGNYYATASVAREDGKRFGVEVARQRRTLTEARRALEETGERGYVQLWDNATATRHVVAELDEAGNWWGRNPFDGTMPPMAPLPVRADSMNAGA